jgi:hypothetical protein
MDAAWLWVVRLRLRMQDADTEKKGLREAAPCA